MRDTATIFPRPCKLTFDLLTLKVVSESHVTRATSVPILIFLGMSVLHLGSIYATNRRQTASSLSLVDYNLSSANLQFSTACGDASLFGVKFFGMDELITRSNISPVDYKILYLLCRRLLGAGA